MQNEKVKQVVILMNLGSPDSTAVKDVRRYLMEFLMDGRVIDKPFIFRSVLVGGIIVPFRAKRSAKAYESIWTKEGSPLIVITRQLQAALADEIPYPVFISMRYGNPTMKDIYEAIRKQYPKVEQVIIVPLYPHYAMSSYETAVEHARNVHARNRYSFQLVFIKPFYDEQQYLHALTESIRPYLEQEYDHLLFSYHGIPERHVLKSDITGNHCLQSAACCITNSPAHRYCYRHQCLRTSDLVAARLQIPANKYSFSFQSRLGRSEWLKPYSVKRLEAMPSEGIRKLVMVCPAFVSDCLETLEEIAAEGRDIFMNAGGESFTLIPCLNVQPLWVKTLANWINATTAGSREMVLT